MRVLIVDDNPDDRRVLWYLVTQKGHRPVEAQNGIEGLELAKADSPDLIISDALMPLMDGFQFLRAVKQEETLRSIPFIFYSSSYRENKDVRLAMSLGADAFVFKPVDPVELWVKIEALLKAGRKAQAPPAPLVQEDVEYLKRYSEVVATKLEKKVQELEQTLQKQQRAEQALRETELKLRTLLESLPVCIARFDAEGRHLYVSPAMTRTFGVPAEAFIGKTLRECGGPSADEQNQALERQIKQTFAEGVPTTLEARWETTTGSRRFEVLHVPERDETGKVVSVLGIAHDITERKQAEETIFKREEEFRALVENAPDAIVRYGRDGRRKYVNPVFQSLAGKPTNQLLGKTPVETFVGNPAVGVKSLAAIQRVVREGKPVEIEVNWKDAAGESHAYQNRFTPEFDRDGTVASVLSVARDITALKRTEDSLRKLSQVVEQSTASIVITDTAGCIEYVNPKFTEVTGYTPAEALGKNPRILKSGELPSELYREMWAAITAGREWRGEFHNRKKDGLLYWESASVSPIRDANGAITHYLAVKEDITAYKRDRERIREQAALLDQTQDAVLVLGLDQRLHYVNRSAERFYALAVGPLSNQSAAALLFQEYPERCVEVCQTTLQRGNWSGELHYLTSLGARRVVSSRWTLIHDTQDRPASFLIVNTDVTEQKQLEEQFLRSQRMESIGTLASGVAHDLNNIFAPILMAADLLRDLVKSPEDREVIAMLDQGARRGADIVKQLLTFGRGFKGERLALQPRSLLVEMAKVIRETFPKNITLAQHFPENLWAIEADPTQIHQVLLNLCVNARDAMPGGGKLTVAAENLMLDATYATMNPEARPGPYVVVQVGDTGTGIPPEIMHKVFDPFFTTKEVGKGTGLGLSTVLGIVKNHGGFVQVNSRVDEGTQFKVYLPATVDAELLPSPSPSAPLPRGNRELVLLVDDEEAIRTVARNILETCGYRVITAADGAEALLALSRSRETIRVVVTDMLMPVLDGASLIRALSRHSRNIRVVAMSGLPGQEEEAVQAGLTAGAFLIKPFSTEKLVRTLHDLLKDPGKA